MPLLVPSPFTCMPAYTVICSSKLKSVPLLLGGTQYSISVKFDAFFQMFQAFFVTHLQTDFSLIKYLVKSRPVIVLIVWWGKYTFLYQILTKKIHLSALCNVYGSSCVILSLVPRLPVFFVIVTDTLYYNAINGGNKEKLDACNLRKLGAWSPKSRELSKK